MKWIDIIMLIVCILLISIIMLQESKEDASRAFSGTKSDLFANKKIRGAEKVVSIITGVLAGLFVVCAILATFVISRF